MTIESPSSRYSVDIIDSVATGKPEKTIRRKDLGENASRIVVSRDIEKTMADLEDPGHPHNVVYVDGACPGSYLDGNRGIFSLDHHEGVPRQFMDAACMQVLKLTRDRTLRALGFEFAGIDPDLDTVMALWAGANADLISHDDRVFRRVLPLFMLEGNIDALGFGYEEFTGLPVEVIQDQRNRINWLMRSEMAIKSDGRWGTVDFCDFTLGVFKELDRYALFQNDFDRPVDFDAHTSKELPDGQTVDLIHASDTGIYPVEQSLRDLDGSNSACVIYTDGKGKITIKLTGLVSKYTLAPVWDYLNELEGKARKQAGVSDERFMKARFGGSEGIGGPPRYPNGRGPFLSLAKIHNAVVRKLSQQVPG